MTQRWNDLLFAHWRVQAAQVAPLLPEGVVVDTFDGSAWLGVVPFWMDRIKVRGIPTIPGARTFPELNMRTYVRDLRTNTPGVYFFSLDGANLLGVMVARSFYHLPYYWARMRMEDRGNQEFSFYSRRRFAHSSIVFKARYRGLGPSSRLAESRVGSLEHFLTERYCLFTHNRLGQLIRANVHHIPWPLEEARAEIERNDLPAVLGIEIRAQDPVLYYSRRLAVYMWPPELAAPARTRQRIPAQAMPSA
ncbi:MAG TPA: DUF2071 domain-containing protein [Terracidiphilus sp.]|nr:DUF2071 domain-containing protein [Terracidiphilus sp.]